MTKMSAAVLTLCAAGMCAAQPAVTTTQSSQTQPKHFRLTFVLTYPDKSHPSQSYALDVPVMRDRPGVSSITLAAGSTGQAEGSVQQSLQCTDVQESELGLAAKVNFVMESVSFEPKLKEPLHHQLTFERKVDLVLGKATRVTDEMQKKPLGKGDEALPPAPAQPEITVTATVI